MIIPMTMRALSANRTQQKEKEMPAHENKLQGLGSGNRFSTILPSFYHAHNPRFCQGRIASFGISVGPVGDGWDGFARYMAVINPRPFQLSSRNPSTMSTTPDLLLPTAVIDLLKSDFRGREQRAAREGYSSHFLSGR